MVFGGNEMEHYTLNLLDYLEGSLWDDVTRDKTGAEMNHLQCKKDNE